MTNQITQQEINDILWKACDSFRGTVDATEYKDYILTMLFVKYISDVWQDHYDEYQKQYGNDEERIRRGWSANASSCRKRGHSTTL